MGLRSEVDRRTIDPRTRLLRFFPTLLQREQDLGGVWLPGNSTACALKYTTVNLLSGDSTVFVSSFPFVSFYRLHTRAFLSHHSVVVICVWVRCGLRGRKKDGQNTPWRTFFGSEKDVWFVQKPRTKRWQTMLHNRFTSNQSASGCFHFLVLSAGGGFQRLMLIFFLWGALISGCFFLSSRKLGTVLRCYRRLCGL